MALMHVVLFFAGVSQALATLCHAVADVLAKGWWLGLGLLTIFALHHYPDTIIQSIAQQQNMTHVVLSAMVESQWAHRHAFMDKLERYQHVAGCDKFAQLSNEILYETALGGMQAGMFAQMGQVMDGFVQTILNVYYSEKFK